MSDHTHPTPTDESTVVSEFTLSTDDVAVVVREVETGMGTRVEFDDGEGTRLRVDAIGLESLAWQDADVFDDFLDRGYEPISAAPSEADDERHRIRVTNEYAHAEVRKLVVDGDEFVEVLAPKKRTRLRTDARGVSGLARQSPSLFSTFLETPHGPDDHH